VNPDAGSIQTSRAVFDFQKAGQIPVSLRMQKLVIIPLGSSARAILRHHLKMGTGTGPRVKKLGGF
jgi:hypothetical protein